ISVIGELPLQGEIIVDAYDNSKIAYLRDWRTAFARLLEAKKAQYAKTHFQSPWLENCRAVLGLVGTLIKRTNFLCVCGAFFGISLFF
ncbi:MAG: hypothetical protein QXL24_03350, partial [Candidatus Jordarchaeaceae archaeon]